MRPLDEMIWALDNSVGESRRLIQFLAVEWESGCLDFHRTERPVLTASARQARQPIYLVGRRRYYQKHLGPVAAIVTEDRSDGLRLTASA